MVDLVPGVERRERRVGAREKADPMLRQRNHLRMHLDHGIAVGEVGEGGLRRVKILDVDATVVLEVLTQDRNGLALAVAKLHQQHEQRRERIDGLCIVWRDHEPTKVGLRLGDGAMAVLGLWRHRDHPIAPRAN